MRPPILWITVGFGAGVWTGLGVPGAEGVGLWPAAAAVLVAAAFLYRRAPLGTAVGVAGVAGMLWGGAALGERADTCAGRWATRGPSEVAG
ncbi:MAG TPA: hypothetical protein VNI61_03305, partial [Gemmatimonadales bacterium]|nr:hypothetical protein [Gemmatimonadales bacterium]